MAKAVGPELGPDGEGARRRRGRKEGWEQRGKK